MPRFLLLIAIAAATAQPTSLQQLFAPPPGSYGWLETLAGSCFSGTGHYGSKIRECFAIQEGRFTITSTYRYRNYEDRSECLLTHASDGQRLRFSCLGEAGRRRNMFARYEGDRVIFEYEWRSRAAPPRDRPRRTWRLVNSNRIAILSTMDPLDQGLRRAVRPIIILERERAPK